MPIFLHYFSFSHPFVKFHNFSLSLMTILNFSEAFWSLLNFWNFGLIIWKRWREIKKSISQLPRPWDNEGRGESLIFGLWSECSATLLTNSPYHYLNFRFNRCNKLVYLSLSLYQPILTRLIPVLALCRQCMQGSLTEGDGSVQLTSLY